MSKATTWEDLQDPAQHLYRKQNLFAEWEPATVEDVLQQCIRPEVAPLEPEEKQCLPVFGFNKTKGSSKNAQQYPTCFVILELDMPARWKEKVKQGQQMPQLTAQAQAYLWYHQIRSAKHLPYFWMYITPSTCGLRFVLRTDQPVIHQDHYKQVVLRFLERLYRFTNGQINSDHYDLRVDQAWYVPTFLDGFHWRDETTTIDTYQETVALIVPPHRIPNSSFRAQSSDQRFQTALRFTQPNFDYQEGQRNKFIHHLACNCNRLGLSEVETRERLLADFDLGETEIRSAVASAYRNNSHEHGKLLDVSPFAQNGK